MVTLCIIYILVSPLPIFDSIIDLTTQLLLIYCEIHTFYVHGISLGIKVIMEISAMSFCSLGVTTM